jgi:hypothetical protein
MSIIHLLLATLALYAATSAPEANACRVYGIVFEEKDPSLATYRVYLTDDEYDADLVVFRETNQLMATKTGIWCFIRNRSMADFTVCFVKDRGMANFTAHFTEFEADARCNQ